MKKKNTGIAEKKKSVSLVAEFTDYLSLSLIKDVSMNIIQKL